MTYTEADLESLKKALLSGAQSVSVQGRTITFRSLVELKSLIAEVEAALNAELPVDEQPAPLKSVYQFIIQPRRWWW